MKNARVILLLLQLTGLCSALYGQHREIDSIKQELGKVHPDTGRTDLLTQLAWKLRMEKADTALICLKDAEALALKANYVKGMGNIHHTYASLYYNKGDYPLSLKHHLLAMAKWDEMEIQKKYGRKEILDLRVRTLTNIGLLYKEQNELEKALEYNFKALKTQEGQENKQSMATLYSNIGLIYAEQKKTDLSLDYSLRSLKLKEELGNKRSIGITLGNIGLVYADRKDTLKALEYFRKAFDIATSIGDKTRITIWAGNLGNFYLHQKKFNEAENYFQLALKTAEEIGSLMDMKLQYENFSKLAQARGDYRKAYEYYQQYTSVKDSLFNEAKARQITELQTKYETEKKEQENTLLSKENEVKSMEIGKQKNQRTYLIILLSLVVITAVVLFNRNRLKHRNRILEEKDLRHRAVLSAQEEEKGRLSQELHDGVGPLFSLIKLNASGIETNSSNEKMIGEIKNLASEGMKEVRNISHALMPALLSKQGLQAAVEEFLGQINQAGGTRFSIHSNLQSNLKPETAVNIFRIIQETLNNVIHHAAAKTAVVSLIETNGYILLTISDDGKGMDLNKKTNGNGLHNIHSRADLLKASFKTESSSEKGTTHIIHIPLEGNV